MSRTTFLHRLFCSGLAVGAVSVLGGCASLTTPIADGIPVRRLPDQVLARPKSELQPVPLNLLRIANPGEYRLDKGDVLGIVADEVLTKEGQPIPFQFNATATHPAAQGIPVTVQDDGTILLPLLDPINVKGKTLLETRNLIVDEIVTKKQLVPKGKEKVVVDLIQSRRYRVLVVREDRQSLPAPGNPEATATKRGSAFTLLLEPGRNDLLQALSQTGGPPGLDAKNEVVIRRGKYEPADPAKGYVRIPLRANPGHLLPFSQADITLNEGDTVYVEARDAETFFVGGLLASGQIPLPRDTDLHVVEAIALARGSTSNAENLGVAHPNTGLVTILRRLPNDQQIPIRVDLSEAFRDPRENILIQAGDLVILQERPGEALSRLFMRPYR